MPGFSNNARVSGGDSVVGALRDYLDRATEMVAEAVQSEQEEFIERQRERAAEDARWGHLADQMRSWEHDGDFAFGVDGDEAAAAEYGDTTHPPSPLLRMGAIRDAALISQRLKETFRRGGF